MPRRRDDRPEAIAAHRRRLARYAAIECGLEPLDLTGFDDAELDQLTATLKAERRRKGGGSASKMDPKPPS